MDPAHSQAQLRAAIAAIRAGDRAGGRRQLVDLLRVDDQLAPAWLWLAAVVDEPADQIMALENALALDPHNAPARQRLAELRALSEPAPPAPETPPPAPLAAAPPAPPEDEPLPAQPAYGVDPDDDPLQCVYCGQMTADIDERCPHCKRNLLAPGPWEGGIYLYSLLIALGLDVQAALVLAAMPLVVASLSGIANLTRLLTLAQLGDGLVSVPLTYLILRFIVLAGLLALFLNDAAWAYWIGAGALAVDVLVQGAAAYFGWLPDTVWKINLGLSSAALVFIGAGLISQQLARRRLYTAPDRGLHSGQEFHRRGREHLRRGRVALAVQNLQKAVRLEPKSAGFYKDLALAQDKLGRRVKARQTLEAGARRAPTDPDFPRLLSALDTDPPANSSSGSAA